MQTILVIEKDDSEARLLQAVLAGEYRVIRSPDLEIARQAILEEKPAAVFLISGAEGLDLVEPMARTRGCPPLIVMSSIYDPRFVVQAVRKGASDFLPRPCPLREIKAALEAALLAGHYAARPFAGKSPALLRATSLLESYAPHDFPVLVLGESGTGKDVAAHAIHDRSPRRGGPFVARNCAALPDELIESELFGSGKGAFTGALDRPGAFELAEGGTLFLDEIGEARLPVQAKLLRALESGEIWRLGARTPKKTNIRLISATSRNLRTAVDEGRFRLDLLYRVETLVLELPPLRERPEDIPELAECFVRAASCGRKSIKPGALEILAAQPWPGNCRQLRNVVCRAVVLSGDLAEIGEEHILI